jgi:hypothetical protein
MCASQMLIVAPAVPDLVLDTDPAFWEIVMWLAPQATTCGSCSGGSHASCSAKWSATDSQGNTYTVCCCGAARWLNR